MDTAATVEALTGGTTKKYDIPLSNLDFGYIKECTDVKRLERIFRILKSGDEGCYPELERCCEDRIRTLSPESRTLRKDRPVGSRGELEKHEQEELDEDLKTWTSSMKYMEDNLATVPTKPEELTEPELPPIRSGTITLTADGAKTNRSSSSTNPNKRVTPRDYREWDKIDVDKELEKVDDDDKKSKEKTYVANKEVKNIPTTVDTSGLTEGEKLLKANREKDKGNEAFRAGDFKEAILYYSRSISLQPTAASYNNRALAHLKHCDWSQAVTDTNTVLNMEPDNIKALLRRGTANKGQKQYDTARHDLTRVLQLEPKNKRAQELLDQIDVIIKKEKEERKKKGRRMKIEDVEEIDQETEASNETENKSNIKLTDDFPGFTTNEDDSGKKKSRRMKIQEVDSDEEDDDKAMVNGHATAQEIISKNGSTVETVKKCDGKDIKKEVDHVTEKLEIISIVDKGKNDEKVQDVNKTNIETPKNQEINKNTKTKTDDSSAKDCADVKFSGNSDQEGNGSDTDSDARTTECVQGSGENAEPAEVLQRPVVHITEMPQNCKAWREEANTLFRSGQYGDACQKYAQVISLMERDANTHVYNLSLMHSNRAACQLKIGDLPGSVKDCSRSLQLIPHSVKPLLRRAMAYEHLERYRLAYIDYRHVLLLDSRTDQAHLGTKRCQEMLLQKDGPRWREKFQLPQVSVWEIPIIEGLDGKPLENVHYNMPSAATSQSQSTCPLNSQSKPSTPSPTNQAAAVEPSAQKRPETVKVEEKPVELSTQQQFDVLKAEGNDYVKTSQFREAIQCYTKCSELFPDEVVPYTNRALCHIRVNQAHDAENDCTKALYIEPDNVKALFRRAQARKMLKRYKDGVEDLKHLLEIDPNNSAAKKEMDVLKNYWREQLQSMKKELESMKKNLPGKDMASTKAASSPSKPASHAKGDKSKSASSSPGKGDKRRKRLVIEEVDSDEGETTPAGEKESGKHKGGSHKTESKPKVEEIASKQPQTQSKSAQSKTDQKVNKGSKGQSSKKPQVIKETSSGLPRVPKTIPKLEKATPFEFISTWNALKKSDTVQPYYELLKQISPGDIKTVISNKLDGHMLSVITRCVAEHYIPNGEEDVSYEILKNLATVPRFGTVSMMMSGQEKSVVKTVMGSLEGRTSNVYSSSDMQTLRKGYGV